MDEFFIHLAPRPRRFPTGLTVQSVGYMPCKTDTVRHVFSTFNFSMILSGCGVYHLRGERFDIQAPCVITQWPGEVMHYGPTEATGGRWEEFYIIYEGAAKDECLRRNLVQIHKPYWPIRRDTQVLEQFSHLMSLLTETSQEGMADRIDRACELLLVETRMAEQRPPAGHEEQTIHRVRQHVREHLFEEHDFNELARRFGLSSATFRRYWKRYMREPPARYVMKLRIREARRLLVETSLTVAEIAEKSGFEDPLYFSRCFRRAAGVPPTHYRARFPR
ncbi:MAG: AraC family transcriptional regulator [bacterium]